MPDAQLFVETIPFELRQLNQWVCWRLEQRKAHWTKVPYTPSGQHARADDPATWSPFDDCWEAVRSNDGVFDGLGFVFNNDYTGIDLDAHRDAQTGDLDDFAADCVKRLASYTEISHSGVGVHVIAGGVLPGGAGRRDSKRGIEMYSQRRFFVVTGRHVKGTPVIIQNRQQEVNELYRELFDESKTVAGNGHASAQPGPDVDGLSLIDAQLIRSACRAKNGKAFATLWAGDWSAYGSQSEADCALLAHLAFWTSGDKMRAFALFDRSGLYRDKWERDDYRERTWEAAHGDDHAATDVEDQREGGERRGKGWTIADGVEEFTAAMPPTVVANGHWYVYTDGLYRRCHDELLHGAKALDCIPRPKSNAKTARLLMDTFALRQTVRADLLKNAVVFEDANQDAVLINCANGLWRVTANDVSQIQPPEGTYFTGRLAAAYKPEYEEQPEAACPNFHAALVRAQPDEAARHLLYWWLGYVLYPSLKFRLALVNFGKSSTGKTTIWVHGVASVLDSEGAELVQRVPLAEICGGQGYSLPLLQHALLNIGGELDAGELGNSSRFKLLVGGESFTARQIYGRPFTMGGYVVKCIFNTNHLPEFRSGTDAENRRLKILLWQEAVEKEDVSLETKIPLERDGILSAYMVPSLQHLLGGWECPPDNASVREYQHARNDPIGAFIERCLDLGSQFETPTLEAFSRWKVFVQDEFLSEGLSKESVFGKLLLQRLAGKVQKRRMGSRGARYHVYSGFRLKDEEEGNG